MTVDDIRTEVNRRVSMMTPYELAMVDELVERIKRCIGSWAAEGMGSESDEVNPDVIFYALTKATYWFSDNYDGLVTDR